MTKYRLKYLFKDENTRGDLRDNIQYILAQDYKYEDKTLKCYHDFENIEDTKRFIKTNENLYELSYKKKRKLYLDLIDHEIEMTREEFMTYIDKLIVILNQELNINTTREDYYIFVIRPMGFAYSTSGYRPSLRGEVVVILIGVSRKKN